jgi:hypothetical protein
MRNIKRFLKKKIIFVYIIFVSIISFFFAGINENKFKTQATLRLANIYILDGESKIFLDDIIYGVAMRDIWFTSTLDLKIEEKFNIPKECILIKKINPSTFAYAKSNSILGLSIGYNKGYNLFIDPESGYLLINFISHDKYLNEMCVKTLISELEQYSNHAIAGIFNQIKNYSGSKVQYRIYGEYFLPIKINFEIIKSTQSFSIKESKIFYFSIYFFLIFLLLLIFFLLKKNLFSKIKVIFNKIKKE